MRLEEHVLKKILLQEHYITNNDLGLAEEYAKSRHGVFLDYLFSKGLLTRDLLGQAIAEFYKIPYADMNSNMPPRDLVQKIPELLAKRLRVVAFKDQKNQFIVATDSPERQKNLLKEIKQLFPKKKCVIAYSLSEDIDNAFIHYRKKIETRISAILKQKERAAPDILNEIMEDALLMHASDVHFEPQEQHVLIRFRIDGILHEAGVMPHPIYEHVLNRIKVQSRLRIDEHRSAQDGSFRHHKKEEVADLRVSITPTINGEKTVIRILSEYVRSFTLADLGLSEIHQRRVEEASRKPFGMILVTGPTGSGKTTTLYALLKILNRPEVNIMTVEDPVEYKISGINQIQVNPQTNLTFAKGLRSIVRQDPDIILVGEIRDVETAEISVNAALTGHLLLSTFHANDASTGIPRLLDMNIEPFLLASTLEIIIAQRLVREICEACRHSVSLPWSVLKRLVPDASLYFSKENVTVYEGKGCPNCGHTGYTGRTAIFEFIEVTPEMNDLILKRPSTKEIWGLAKSQGATSLFDDGIEKVKNGVTTVQELLRVANPPHVKMGYKS